MTGSPSAIDVAHHPWWKACAGLRLHCSLCPIRSRHSLVTGTVQQKGTQAYYIATFSYSICKKLLLFFIHFNPSISFPDSCSESVKAKVFIFWHFVRFCVTPISLRAPCFLAGQPSNPSCRGPRFPYPSPRCCWLRRSSLRARACDVLGPDAAGGEVAQAEARATAHTHTGGGYRRGRRR
jgi:hypothetical protein